MAGVLITEDERAKVGATIFHHLAGIVLIPTIKALYDGKVFELFGNLPEPVALDRIVDQTHGNRGYLRVALRLLASCGWMQARTEMSGHNVDYSFTAKGNIAA